MCYEMTEEQKFSEKASDYGIPQIMHRPVFRYVRYGELGGPFLTALMENDFMAILREADGINKRVLENWARFIYNALPSGCWGSREQVIRWSENGGMSQWDGKDRP